MNDATMAQRGAWLDCPSGIAGDMILASLLDAGLPMAVLDDVIQRLGLEGVGVEAREIHRGGLRALLVDVTAPAPASDGSHAAHVHLSGILRRLDASGLPDPVVAGGKAIFQRLAEAEARVHGTTTEQVHFHEVGAVDALVDVVGAVAGFHHFGVLAPDGSARLVASPLPLGHGTTVCAHGTIPLPGPAVVEMLVGVASYGVDVAAETVTPTGLAVLRGLSARFGIMPALSVCHVGRGAGHRDLPLPGPLRLVIGDLAEESVAGARPASAADPLGGIEIGQNVELQATIDDMNPQWFGPAFDAILAAGALDVSVASVLMKKGRPGYRLSALCAEEARQAVALAILRHTSSIGLRAYRVEKWALPRRMEQVETPWGSVPVKVVSLDGEVLRAIPEHDIVQGLAETAGLPVSLVHGAALRAYHDE